QQHGVRGEHQDEAGQQDRELPPGRLGADADRRQHEQQKRRDEDPDVHDQDAGVEAEIGRAETRPASPARPGQTVVVPRGCAHWMRGSVLARAWVKPPNLALEAGLRPPTGLSWTPAAPPRRREEARMDILTETI